MEITKERASNFWNYFTLSTRMEMSFYMQMFTIFEGIQRSDFYDDNKIKEYAEVLGCRLNQLNLPESGKDNKYVGVMNMARAYVQFMSDQYGNNSYMNAGSFWLICCRIALHVD